jgi:hypothetical protein
MQGRSQYPEDRGSINPKMLATIHQIAQRQIPQHHHLSDFHQFIPLTDENMRMTAIINQHTMLNCKYSVQLFLLLDTEAKNLCKIPYCARF